MSAVNPPTPSGPQPARPVSTPVFSVTRVLAGPLPRGRILIPFLALRGLLLLLLAIFFLPTYFFDTPGFGAEPSWKLALSRAVSEGWGFGDRIVWTYGPLGFLEWRFPYGIQLGYYFAFDLLLLGLFLRFAIDVAKAHPDALLGWACLGSLFTVKRVLHDQPSVALYCALCYLLLRQLRRRTWADGLALVVVSVVLLLFKMNFGLMGFFVCAVIVGFQAKGGQKSCLIWLALLAAQVGLAWLVALRFDTNLFAYLKSSFAVVRQYNDMSWGPGPGGVAHWVVFGFFWMFVLGAAAFLRRNGFRTQATLYLLLGGAAVFLLYKTALIRSDYNHNKCFLLGFPLICLAFVVHGPEPLRRLWRCLFLGSTFYTSLLMAAEFGNALIYMQPEYLKAFFPINYIQGIKSYREHAQWGDYVREMTARYPERVLPPNLRQFIGTNSVDVFPFESTLALASGLNYQPRPIPLTYAVMGGSLEDRNLAFLQSPQAPRFLLWVLGEKAYSIDGRYSLWEEPAVKRLVAQHYAPHLVFTNLQGAPPETEPQPSPVLLLRRTTNASLPSLVAVSKARERTGAGFVLPDQREELYASLHLQKSWLGRLTSFFYRGSEVNARFTLDDGSVHELRVVPANLENGVLLNYFMDGSNPTHMVNYLTRESRGNPKCLKLEIHPLRSWAYRRQFEVIYLRPSPTP
jgi:hypothetical protein